MFPTFSQVTSVPADTWIFFGSNVSSSVISTVEASVLSGRPHRAIVDYAAEYDVDLIVMGTHGRTGLDRYLLGSVTERVVRLSDVPVLAVGEEAEDEADEAVD